MIDCNTTPKSSAEISLSFAWNNSRSNDIDKELEEPCLDPQVETPFLCQPREGTNMYTQVTGKMGLHFKISPGQKGQFCFLPDLAPL